MTELDTPDAFDTRFAAAYRRFLDEVPVDVDAAEVARSVVARPRSRWQLRPWALRRVPALAWALVLTGLLAGVVVGALLAGARHPDPAVEPAGDLPAGITGTWLDMQSGSSRMITLSECRVDEVCGRVVEEGPSKTCEYSLTLRSSDADSAEFELGPASFPCSWSSLPGSRREVRRTDPGTLEMTLPGSGTSSWVSLQRADLPALLAHPAAVPLLDRVSDRQGEAAGGPDISLVLLRRTLDHLVVQVELAETPAGDTPWSLTAWLNTDRTGSCNPYVSAYVIKLHDVGGSRAGEAGLQYAPHTFGSAWFGTPGRTEPASYDLAYAIDGPWVTIVIPLEQLANPRTIGFRLHTFDGLPGPDDQPRTDDVPTTETGDLCREVDLTWE